jgi:hypothetical protein
VDGKCIGMEGKHNGGCLMLQGQITSIYGPTMERYTGVGVVPRHTHPHDMSVRAMCTIDAGVLALSQRQLRLQHRTAIPILTHMYVDVV